MGSTKVKKEVLELIDNMPEEYIPAVITYIKDLLALREQDEEAAAYLTEIMNEDDNLLKRLAK